MSVLATLDDPFRHGIAVEVQGANLVLKGPTDILTDELVTSLRLAKAELLLTVRCKNASRWDAEDCQAYFEERAAIREYDGGLPRDEAERLAFEDTVTHWFVLNPTAKGAE